MGVEHICRHCGVALPLKDNVFTGCCQRCAAVEAQKMQIRSLADQLQPVQQEKDITDRVERVTVIEHDGGKDE